MKLIVEQVYPTQGLPLVMVSEKSGQPFNLEVGSVLRCMGYKFAVVSIRGTMPSPQVGLELQSLSVIRAGMILRPATEPLDADEVVSMLMRTVHLLQCLNEMAIPEMALALASIPNTTNPALVKMASNPAFLVAASIYHNLGMLAVNLPPRVEQQMFAAMATELNNAMQLMPMATAEA